ncbi:MAG: glutathione S-transferase [Pseudomonadota bacterium]
MSTLPILYSFRRCPYAMRARMALWVAGITVELREVKLANKPPELAQASPKATVPVLVLPDGSSQGTVIEESLAIMRWALEQNDPEGWLAGEDTSIIERNDGPFKRALDRYKYPTRYPDEAAGDEETFRFDHRSHGLAFLEELNSHLAVSKNLSGPNRMLTDIALFPFVRQFANTDRDWFDAVGLPLLQLWLEEHLASDLFAAIMPKFNPWKAGDAPITLGPEADSADCVQRI